MNLQPKTIEPGWAKRWTRQSIELFRRAPHVAVGVMTLFGLMNALIPQPLAMNVPITIFLMGLLFSGLRAADHDSGNAMHATWTFFRQTVRDLAHLARDAFLVMMAFGIAVGLFFFFYSAATHGAGVVKPGPHYLQLPYWLRHGIFRADAMLELGIFLPGAIPLVFLTMSVGNQPLMHYVTGYKAAVLNLPLSYGMIILITVCAALVSVLESVPSFRLACAFLAGFAAAFWWFGTWGYLWCREMFEGTKENARKTARQSSRVHAAA